MECGWSRGTDLILLEHCFSLSALICLGHARGFIVVETNGRVTCVPRAKCLYHTPAGMLVVNFSGNLDCRFDVSLHPTQCLSTAWSTCVCCGRNEGTCNLRSLAKGKACATRLQAR